MRAGRSSLAGIRPPNLGASVRLLGPIAATKERRDAVEDAQGWRSAPEPSRRRVHECRDGMLSRGVHSLRGRGVAARHGHRRAEERERQPGDRAGLPTNAAGRISSDWSAVTTATLRLRTEIKKRRPLFSSSCGDTADRFLRRVVHLSSAATRASRRHQSQFPQVHAKGSRLRSRAQARTSHGRS